MKVLFTTCFLSPYRIDFFNELGKFCDVIVLAEENSARQTHRNPKWFSKCVKNFQLVNLHLPRKGKRAKGIFIWRYVKKYNADIVVIGGYSTNTEIINLLMSRFHKEKVFLNFDGIAVDNIYNKSIKDLVKKCLIKSVDYYLISGRETQKFLEKYHVNREQMFEYPFTSLYEKEILKSVITKDEKAKIKSLLNIQEEKVIISVGRFIESKGFDVLLETAQHLPENTGVYIIGDKPTEKYKKMAEKVSKAKVHFVDFQHKKVLSSYYCAADIFVLPTRSDVWGLVINEAMASGLPVITTDRCVAGLELIKDEENGYIIPIDDVTMLSERLNNILDDEKKRMLMSQNSLKKIQKYSIENMAKTHLEIFKEVLKDE